MGKGLVDVVLDKIFDAEWMGRRGEKLVERELKLVKLLGRKGYILRNVYIPKSNGETSEIDVLYITQKGIFVIESKNYTGWIFGNETQKNWTVSLPDRTKINFYNPVKQNKTHIKWLNNYLDEDIPSFSIIVFSERCELKKVTLENPCIHVIKRDRLYATVRKIWENTDDVLSEGSVDIIYKKLKDLMNVNDAVKRRHIENIKNKIH